MKKANTNKCGSVLIVVLWILAILAIYAVSLGRRSNQELSLVERSLAQLKARHLAWGGIMFSIAQIARDSKDKEQQGTDNLYRCAIALKDGETPEQIFAPVHLSDGYFEIGYVAPGRDPGLAFADDDTGEVSRPGFSDEDRKINLNALNAVNGPVFRELLILRGAEPRLAEMIVASSIDWIDADSNVSSGNLGEEGRYYESLKRPYKCKNRPFDQVQELLLIKGMTPELFAQVKDYVTVYPKSGSPMLVNSSTASPLVLQALARSVAGLQTNTDISEADSLVKKILDFRAGFDGQEATADDRIIDPEKLPLNAKERAIFLAMTQYLTSVSKFVRIQVRGVEEKGRVRSLVDAVIDRRNLSVVAWNRS